MPILFSIGPINFDLFSLISFVIGVVFGFLIMFLMYLYALILNLNKNLRVKKTDEINIDEEEIKYLIEDAQNQFKDKELRQNIGFSKYLMQIIQELGSDIAKKFFPHSKYPYLEITIDESLELNRYITDRVEELLSGKIFVLVKGWTYARLVQLNETKNKIEDTTVVKQAKKYGKVATTALHVANAINPVYWIRKLTTETLMNVIMVRIGLAIIGISGEEMYKIYSKKVFDMDVDIDTGIDKIYEDLKEDLKDVEL